ncbi:hypothetical protein PF005_g3852 [Phytophthora fragariae]|uniref:Ubiquitin-like domain-containing protein n=1 Tax=Phytophthora fragariae TaxID=53985 RepID=A0A6A3FQQ6_9STRA|nr:hypothetical protein PF003_g2413 [Phytophthora fragariae]KAE8946330.1 hypothetical protein PF009_g4028 [Phytophthora fragariae]KAE9030288.1 hypothetical protein PF011_g695 [Phytophthora fragariae]KAE9128807.1 hypothetical protein PF010_g4362 [Phytophthora fragariae]KAE9132067.1 hypothetical protein PF007_g3861 [Phytophthora fragariae]
MAPKKKAKKSKKSSAAADAGDGGVDGSSLMDNTPPIIIEADPVHYVTLDMRLLNWSYLNFKFRTKTTTRLFAIKQQIQKQHGPITDLKICKGHFSEANEMRHDMMTLAEFGIEGAPEGNPEVVCLIHYDFKPEQHDNPLLLATEQN